MTHTAGPAIVSINSNYTKGCNSYVVHRMDVNTLKLKLTFHVVSFQIQSAGAHSQKSNIQLLIDCTVNTVLAKFDVTVLPQYLYLPQTQH